MNSRTNLECVLFLPKYKYSKKYSITKSDKNIIDSLNDKFNNIIIKYKLDKKINNYFIKRKK